MFNCMLNTFHLRHEWAPLATCHFRELLFTYCKWLLVEGWTPHRVFKQLHEYPERFEEAKKEESDDMDE